MQCRGDTLNLGIGRPLFRLRIPRRVHRIPAGPGGPDFRAELLPQFLRPFPADAGKHPRQPLESGFIRRVRHEFQPRGHILDVGLLKKADPAGDAERDVAPGQFQLQLERMEMRPVKDGHLVDVAALLAQFKNALRDKGGLLRRLGAGHQHRLEPRTARRRKLLRKLMDVGGDRRIGQRKDFGRAPVIGFNLEHFRPRIPVRELHDVPEVGPPPCVDALGIVPHHHHVPVPRAEQIDELALKLVRVLVFVHQHELKLALIQFARLLVLLQQPEPEHEQIIEIHHVGRPLALREPLDHILNLRRQARKIIVIPRQHLGDRATRVHRHRRDVRQHVGLRKPGRLDVDRRFAQARLHQFAGILAIQDRVIPSKPEQLRVAPQETRSDGMKRAAPQRLHVAPQQIRDAAHHLARRLVGEGQEENAIRRHPLLQQIRHTIRQRPRLARTRSRDHQRGPRRGSHGGMLLLIQFLRIVDLQIDSRVERLQYVLA